MNLATGRRDRITARIQARGELVIFTGFAATQAGVKPTTTAYVLPEALEGSAGDYAAEGQLNVRASNPYKFLTTFDAAVSEGFTFPFNGSIWRITNTNVSRIQGVTLAIYLFCVRQG